MPPTRIAAPGNEHASDGVDRGGRLQVPVRRDDMFTTLRTQNVVRRAISQAHTIGGRCGRRPDGCEPSPDHRTKIVRNVF